MMDFDFWIGENFLNTRDRGIIFQLCVGDLWGDNIGVARGFCLIYNCFLVIFFNGNKFFQNIIIKYFLINFMQFFFTYPNHCMYDLGKAK